tara:strand:- start:12155 stop:13360 length:1206 start_codon:yes stop_codon:yes gene_type:complete
MKIRPIILSGGAGTRLWPNSNKNIPKQFIDWGGWTLFDKTLERIKSTIFDYPIITTNFRYLDFVKKHLNKNKIKKYRIILEPYKKNTAAAILSSVLIKEIPYHQPVIFFSSDNIIGKIKVFNNSIESHKNRLTNRNIFIFGIKPKSASSEYGYLLTKKKSNNINQVFKFIEKPNPKKAKDIIRRKGYMNAGIFFARKDSLINNFKKYRNKIYLNCLKSVERAKTKKKAYFLNKKNFGLVQDISFDYAILEKSNDVNAIKLNIPLVDMGNWKEIWKFFIYTTSKKKIKSNTYFRPWGKYINLFRGKNFLLKELTINPKSSISLQKHKFRSEKWTIISGKPKITLKKKKFFMKKKETVFIPKGFKHRIENIYNDPVKIVEVQMGPILSEDDIVRYKDVYGRII